MLCLKNCFSCFPHGEILNYILKIHLSCWKIKFQISTGHGPALPMLLIENSQPKIHTLFSTGPLKAPGPLVTTLVTPPPSRRSCLLTSLLVFMNKNCLTKLTNFPLAWFWSASGYLGSVRCLAVIRCFILWRVSDEKVLSVCWKYVSAIFCNSKLLSLVVQVP